MSTAQTTVQRASEAITAKVGHGVSIVGSSDVGRNVGSGDVGLNTGDTEGNIVGENVTTGAKLGEGEDTAKGAAVAGAAAAAGAVGGVVEGTSNVIPKLTVASSPSSKSKHSVRPVSGSMALSASGHINTPEVSSVAPFQISLKK